MKTKKTILLIFIILIMVLLWACQKDISFEARVIYDSSERDYRESPQKWIPAAELDIYKGQELFQKTDTQGRIFFSIKDYENINNIAYKLEVKEPYRVVDVDSYFEKKDKMVLLVFIEEQTSTQEPPPYNENQDEDERKEQEEIRLAREGEESSSLRGYITDIDYNRIEGVDIFFGEKDQKAATSNQRGEFVINYINPQFLSPKRVMDFLRIEIEGYKYKLFSEYEQENTKCVFVIEEKSSELNMEDIIIKPLIKCTFGYLLESEVAIILPAGYPVGQNLLEDGGIAAEGDSFSGVSLYINGKFITKSNVHGFDIDFIVPGSEIRVERQGFYFGIRYGHSPMYLLENDTLIYDMEYDLLEIRGVTDDAYALFDNQ